MSESTLYKLEHRNEEYAAALAAGRDTQMTEAVQSLNSCTGAAVNALRKIVDDARAQDMAKVAAARALLEFALRFSESTNASAAPAVVVLDDVPRVSLPALLAEDVEIEKNTE